MIDNEEAGPVSAREMEDMMSEFQNIDTPSDSLVRAVRRGHRKLLRGRVLGIALSAVVWVGSIAIFALKRDASSFLLGAAQIGVNAWIVSFVFRSSRNAWNARSNTTRGFLELELERTRDWIRRMRFLMGRAIPAMFGILVVHHAYLIHQNPAMLSSGLLTMAVPYLILVIVMVTSRRRQARFEARAENIAGQIVDLSDNETQEQL